VQSIIRSKTLDTYIPGRVYYRVEVPMLRILPKNWQGLALSGLVIVLFWLLTHFVPVKTLFGVWIAIFGLVFLGIGYKSYRKSRILKNTPLAPIRSLSSGVVHIRGRAVATQTLTSPISKLPCVYYQVQVEFLEERWSLDLLDTGHVKFHLQDASGGVSVDILEAQLDLPRTFRAEIGRNASKKRTIDPVVGGGPSARELLNYLSQANAKIQAGPAFPHLSGSWAHDARQVIDLKKAMARGLVAYKGESISFLPAVLPPEVDGQRLRFTETCLLLDREYEILGTCIQNPNPTAQHDGKLIARGQKQSMFLIYGGVRT
jgi:hypothetical protein